MPRPSNAARLSPRAARPLPTSVARVVSPVSGAPQPWPLWRARADRRGIATLRTCSARAAAIGIALSIAAVGCDSSSTTTTGPSPVKCQVALATASTALAASGGTGTVSVSTQPECAWSATAEAAWISGLSPASGQGNGQVAFRVPANPLPSARQGAIAVNDNRVSIRQDAATCTFEIAPLTTSVAAGGGAGSVTVTTGSGCSWTATSNAAWIKITSGAKGAGSGSVAFTVADQHRCRSIGTITIAGQTVTLTQVAPVSVRTRSRLWPVNRGDRWRGGRLMRRPPRVHCALDATRTASGGRSHQKARVCKARDRGVAFQRGRQRRRGANPPATAPLGAMCSG